MTARVFASLEELESALDQPLGPGDWLVVDQERIDAFADATGDHQWIHVDPERAAAGPFGRTIAHGYLTLSLIPHFGRQLFRLDLGQARINYGVDKARFPSPVPVGSRLRAQAVFAGLRQTAAGPALTTRYTIEIDGGRKPACVADTITLVLQG
ncbi:MaoC family dehydratase [Nonomuraea basaltis]|uniref:MaoC family dehydratase n=1 Tax=Nonomuraea basaltis TaxID=2495887 RepID=UPI00110C6535|nr:MaoC family dehydratase [Nonomuraea basaltis]TMR99861.1 MaoC family dehydratase [Nonomuraea basaltis]